MFHIHSLIRVGKWGSYSKTLDFVQVIQGVLLQEDSMHLEKLLVRVVGGSVPAVPCLPCSGAFLIFRKFLKLFECCRFHKKGP